MNYLKIISTLFLVGVFGLTSYATCTSGDCNNGYGFFDGTVHMIMDDGNQKEIEVKYNGFFESGKFHDFGRIEYPSGGVFIGQFSNGNKNGRGFYTEGGLSIIGDYVNGRKHGKLFSFLGETLLEAGVYENGKQIEDLSVDYNASKVKGDCQGDCKNGFGTTYTSSINLSTIGFYKKGKIDGTCFISKGSGYLYIGESKLTKGPRFAIEMKDGMTYIGWFEKDEYNGQGLLSFPDKSQQAGEFKKGKYKG